MEPSKKKADLKSNLVKKLHEPLTLRWALCLGLLAVWYFLGFTSMDGRIVATTSDLERDRKRLGLATEVEALRAEEAEFVDRLPPRSDPNEFLQYVLGGVRSGPLKLVSLSPDKPKEAGLFEVASVKLEVEGKYKDVESFLRWVEANKRLLRVDALSIAPDSRDLEALRVQLTILGLMGVEAPKVAPSKTKDAAPRAKAPNPASKGVKE